MYRSVLIPAVKAGQLAFRQNTSGHSSRQLLLRYTGRALISRIERLSGNSMGAIRQRNYVSYASVRTNACTAKAGVHAPR
jgi:hypothetical protein